MQKKVNIAAVVLLTLCLVNMAVQYFSGHVIQAQLFNSDALYLPTLFADLLSSGGKVGDWFLTPAPYFFPDFPMFLLAYLAGHDPYIQIAAFALIQAIVTLAAVWFLAKETGTIRPFFAASTVLVALIWLGLNAGEPLSLIFNSAYHYGTFLVSVVLAALWLRFGNGNGNGDGNGKKQHRKPVFYVLLAGLVFAATLSDNLFLVQFVVPIIATHLLVSLAARDFSWKNMLPLVCVIVSAALGSVSYKWIVAHHTRYGTNIGSDKLVSNLKEVAELFRAAFVGTPVFGVIFVLYLGVVLYSLVRLIQGKKDQARVGWLAIFSFLSLGATLGALLLVTNLAITGRYLIHAFTWAVIVLAFFLYGSLRERFVAGAGVLSLLAVASLSLVSYKLVNTNGFKIKYYPEEIVCIDNALQTAQVDNGIAQYWDAKYLQNFSRLHPNIAQHLDNLSEMPWITSQRYFKPSYDFAIVSEQAAAPFKLSPEVLARINGQPRQVVACGSKSVLVYGKNKLRIKKIADVGDAYTWKACELPTIIGDKKADCSMEKKDRAQPGYVTFGPYEPLPSGEYAFEIAYASLAGGTATVGDWDVVLALPQEAKVLNKGLMGGTAGVGGTIVGTFTLAPNQHMEKIEIRTLARPDVDLKVMHVRVQRVK